MSESDRTQQLEGQVARMRIDMESAQADVVAKNRQIAHLKRQLSEQAEGGPLAADVKEVLDFWKAVLNHPRAKTPSDGARAAAVRKQLKTFTVKELKQAIIGCGRTDWYVRNGKTDIKMICQDEAKVEELRAEALKPFGPVAAGRPDAVRRSFDKGSADPCGEFLIALGHAGFDAQNLAVGSWKAQCPAHRGDDKNLAVREGDNGDCLVKCWSHNCTVTEICDAVGLPVAALFKGTGSSLRSRVREQQAADKQFGEAVVQAIRTDGQLDMGMAA